MPVTAAALVRAAATTGSTTLYTVPASTTAIITEVTVTNTAGTSGTFTLSLDGVSLFTTVTIAANTTTSYALKQVLTTGKLITGLASAITINFHISGVLIT